MTNQRCDVGIIMSYPIGKTATKASLANKRPFWVIPTVVTTGAAVIANVASIVPGDLPQGEYAVSRVLCYSATGKAFFLRCSEFLGLTPGGPIGTTQCHRKNIFDFGDFDECPVFSTANTLFVDLLTVSAETPVLALELVKLS